MAAPRCPPRQPPPRGKSRDPAPPPGRGLRAQHRRLQRDPAQALRAGALRGGLGRLRLRAEEAERLTGLYRRLGAHLQEEAGAARGRLEQLEAELGRRRRRLRELRDLRATGPRPGGRRGGPGREREVGARRAQGARPRALEEEQGQEPPGPPEPPPESPEPEEGLEGGPPPPPPEPPARRPAPPGSTSPQRPAGRAVGPGLAALARGNALALGQLRAEAAALGERLQRLRYGGAGPRAGAQRRAAELRQQLGQEQRRREGARRDLAEVTRALATASAGLQHLAGRLRHLALEDGGGQAQPPPGDPQTLPQLLAQTRARLAVLQGGLGGHPQAQRPPPSTPHQLEALLQRGRPDTEDPTAAPHSSDEEGAAPPTGAPPSRAAIKRQSRLILEGRRGGRGGRGPPVAPSIR